MTKKIGRPIKFTDVYHTKWRHDQTAYNHELYAICREFDCTMKEARIVRRKRLAERQLKELQQEAEALQEPKEPRH